MKNILLKLKDFFIKYKKKIIKTMGISFLAIIIVLGGMAAFIYSKAQSSINYSQDQLQQVALEKVPGEVVEVDKKLNFRQADFVYEFKIKDKENMLQEVKVDSKYGTLSGLNNEKHNKENNKRNIKSRD